MSGGPHLRTGDVVLVRGRGVVAGFIRFFTRSFGESRTNVSHVGLIVEGGPLESSIFVEARHKVVRHSLWGRYAGTAVEVAVYRPSGLSPDEIAAIARKAESYVGRRYGYTKVLAHWLDWILQGAYVFRRLADEDQYPICSWLVAHSFEEVGKHFDVAPGAATPDDIWDFVTRRTDQFDVVMELGQLPYGRKQPGVAR